LEFLGKRKEEEKFCHGGDAPLATLKFSRRKTQGSNHLMFVA